MFEYDEDEFEDLLSQYFDLDGEDIIDVEVTELRDAVDDAEVVVIEKYEYEEPAVVNDVKKSKTKDRFVRKIKNFWMKSKLSLRAIRKLNVTGLNDAIEFYNNNITEIENAINAAKADIEKLRKLKEDGLSKETIKTVEKGIRKNEKEIKKLNSEREKNEEEKSKVNDELYNRENEPDKKDEKDDEIGDDLDFYQRNMLEQRRREEALAEKYNFIGAPDEFGWSYVQSKDSKLYGYIDMDDKEVIPCMYSILNKYGQNDYGNEELAVGKLDGSDDWLIIDREHNAVTLNEKGEITERIKIKDPSVNSDVVSEKEDSDKTSDLENLTPIDETIKPPEKDPVTEGIENMAADISALFLKYLNENLTGILANVTNMSKQAIDAANNTTEKFVGENENLKKENNSLRNENNQLHSEQEKSNNEIKAKDDKIAELRKENEELKAKNQNLASPDEIAELKQQIEKLEKQNKNIMLAMTAVLNGEDVNLGAQSKQQDSIVTQKK